MKIINPQKRSQFQIREVHGFKTKLTSVTELRMKLIEEFGELVPDTVNFSMGYFHGKQSGKHWLATTEDLSLMYETIGSQKREILLWCDGRSEAVKSRDTTARGSKRKSSEGNENRAPNKRKQIEEEVTDNIAELKSKHALRYTLPQLRLWARMIASGNHDSFDDPPMIPALTGTAPARRRTPLNVIAGAIAGAIQPQNPAPVPVPAGRSPRQISELRLKKLQELRELQQLLELNVLTREEFAEQKEIVLDSLRQL